LTWLDPRSKEGASVPAVHEIPAVEVHALAKRFGESVALDGVTFVVHPGEVLGLLGPNGAGKTTTLHILLGVVRPDAGTVRLFGHDPHDGTKTALRRVGFASPEAMMDWRLSVEENLRIYAMLYGVGPEAIARAIATLELEGLARSRFGDLSLGQQTRAGLARALLHDPDLLILDEPTSSLDPDVAEKTRRALEAIRRRRGLAVLYTSHNMVEVEEMCDRVLFLHRGHIVAEGSPLEVSRQVLGSTSLDEAAMEEVFLKIARGGAA
jgi:ABC-2 type transport system ATP-binding protein